MSEYPQGAGTSGAAVDRLEAELTRLREENERLLDANVSIRRDLQASWGEKDRLRRIEEAARELLHADEAQLLWEGADPAPEDSIMGQLRAALADQPTEEKA